MNPSEPTYDFYGHLARIINAGQSRSILLTGNVYDLFFTRQNRAEGSYEPLIPFLCDKCSVPGMTLLVYELNGPIRVVPTDQRESLRSAWTAWRLGVEPDLAAFEAIADRRLAQQREAFESDFEGRMRDAIGQPTVALEFLRQLTICSRSRSPKGKSYITDDLMIVVEAADFLLPQSGEDVSRLSAADRRRVGIVQDWFSDPAFMRGSDSVVLVAESRGMIHRRVAALPQVLAVDVPPPDLETRRHFVNWFASRGESPPPKLWASEDVLAMYTAGLSIHALRQLLVGSAYANETLTPTEVIQKVGEFIESQLGEDVVEFKKPEHTLEDVIGFRKLKGFLNDELIPRFQSTGADALPGAAVSGPIGSGKTFIFEAVASALDMPVLVLKNIRSQWYGQTDVVFERLRRVLEALVKVVIFVDEADTQFGGVGAEAHSTERRLTGKVQQMMSDPRLRGRVIWLLMTARIHLLSPDIRRPGRVGDLVIPVLDPEGEDRQAFLKWVTRGVLDAAPSAADLKRLDELTAGYSAAAFASLRSNLKARTVGGLLKMADVEAIVHDHIPPAIEKTRRYQTLQALVNCTRRSLLPEDEASDDRRDVWRAEILRLEAEGIR